MTIRAIWLIFGIVDIGTVKGYYFVIAVMAWSQHKRVICCSRSKLHIAMDSFVGMDYRVNLDAALFLSSLRMASYTLEYSV